MPVSTRRWFSVLDSLPGDGDMVYVRRVGDAAYAVATFDLSAKTFTTTSGIVLPAYIVTRWTSYP